jgi:arsenite methyltransferase
MKWTSALLFFSLVILLACSGQVTRGSLKRLMYEEPGRDKWQKTSEVVKALALAPGDHVADLGAGGGYFTYPIAEAVGKAGRVYAVDVDESLLAYVASQAEKRGLDQIVTVHAPEDGLGLDDGSVDMVFLSNVFHHLPDPTRYFQGARRVLRSGGRLTVIEVSEGGFPKGHSTPPAEIRAALEAAGYELVEQHAFLERQSFQVFAIGRDSVRN